MRDNFPTTQLWTCSLLIVSLSPLAIYFGSLWGWTPGAASLAMLAVPTCAAALTGNRIVALVVAALAAGGCLFEAVFTAEATDAGFGLSFPLFAAGMLFAAASVITAMAGRLRERVWQLEEQNTRHVRELYQRTREKTDTDSEQTAPAAVKHDAADRTGPLEQDDVNYPMLLLTLQDIGRRVSTNLDLDTLIPTIQSTAKASLKCDRCQVYFWNARDKKLTNALPARQRERSQYVPRPETGMAGWVLERRQILTRQTIETDYALHALLEEEPDLPDAIAPLSVGGELLGLLIVDKIEQDSQTFVRLLYVLANIYALGIKNAQLFKRIEEMARRDGLTGLLNHASFQQELQKLVEQATGSTPLCVVMADVDHFKKFNDLYGHQAGDQVLREVARLWKAVMPDYAVLARYGGEEFICALPQDDLARGRELAELLRENIEDYTIDFEGRELHVTASFGVAEFGRPAKTSQELVRLADEALYDAKEAGRNCVVCSPATDAGDSAEESQPVDSAQTL